MQTIRWSRWLAAGVMVVPISAHAQGPQPIIHGLGVIPGLDVEYAVRMPNGRVIVFSTDDSIGTIQAYDIPTRRLTLITYGWGDDLQISPKGDRIAYTRYTDDDNAAHVWSIPIDPRTAAPTGPAQRVSTGEGASPSFSPDGKEIAFGMGRVGRSDPQSLAILPSTGGPARELARYPTQVDKTYWSEDGKWVYAQVGGNPDTSKLVVRVPASGGRSETLITYPKGRSSEGSIDGRIAFYRPDGLPRGDGRIAYVTAAGARGEFSLPTGSSTGRDLDAPQTLLTSTHWTTVMRALDVTTGSSRVVATEPGTAHNPSWSPDGRRLAYTSGRDDSIDVVVMNADGTGRRRFPVTGGSAVGNGASFWSPDGDALVYYSNGGRQLRVIALASGTSRVVATFDAPNLMSWPVVWRHGGKAFLAHVHSVSPSGTRSAYRLVEFDLDGSQHVLRNLSDELPGFWGGKVLNERTLLGVVGDSLEAKLFLIPVDGGSPVPVAMPPVPSGDHPTWGAISDKWVARLIYHGPDLDQIQLISLTGAPGQTLSSPQEKLHPFGPMAFSTDDRHLYLFGFVQKPANITLYSLPVDGGKTSVITTIPDRFDVGMSAYYGLAAGWSADRTKFLFSSNGTVWTAMYGVDLRPVLQAVLKP